MKNKFTILLLAITTSAFSQVIIGDDVGTVTDKTSVLLEFPTGQNKGIILPYVNNIISEPLLVAGTIMLDASNPAKAKVKYYKGFGNWFDLSNGNEADITSEMALQNGTPEEILCAKVIIGATSSAADGVLILESTTKAMILPIVASTDDIPSPAPGMMVYINKAGAKRLAVYNGAAWTFWKP